MKNGAHSESSFAEPALHIRTLQDVISSGRVALVQTVLSEPSYWRETTGRSEAADFCQARRAT